MYNVHMYNVHMYNVHMYNVHVIIQHYFESRYIEPIDYNICGNKRKNNTNVRGRGNN